MTTNKHALPPRGHITIATAVTEALVDIAEEELATLPDDMRETFAYLSEVTETVEKIQTEQADRMASYRDELVADLVESCAVDADAAELVADALAGSYSMARILADVASGDLVPVAVSVKSPATGRKTSSTRTPRRKKATSSTSSDKAKKDTPDPEVSGVSEVPEAPETSGSEGADEPDPAAPSTETADTTAETPAVQESPEPVEPVVPDEPDEDVVPEPKPDDFTPTAEETQGAQIRPAPFAQDPHDDF